MRSAQTTISEFLLMIQIIQTLNGTQYYDDIFEGDSIIHRLHLINRKTGNVTRPN